MYVGYTGRQAERFTEQVAGDPDDKSLFMSVYTPRAIGWVAKGFKSKDAAMEFENRLRVAINKLPGDRVFAYSELTEYEKEQTEPSWADDDWKGEWTPELLGTDHCFPEHFRYDPSFDQEEDDDESKTGDEVYEVSEIDSEQDPATVSGESAPASNNREDNSTPLNEENKGPYIDRHTSRPPSEDDDYNFY